MTTTTHPPPRRTKDALRAAWSAAHRPAPRVTRQARLAAFAVPFLVLPSSAWRIAVCTFHLPLVRDLPPDASGDLPSWLPLEIYVILLSVASELLAFTAVGLVATWGVTFPIWIPWLGGRSVPALLATLPAAAGAVVLTLLTSWVAITSAFGVNVRGEPVTVHVLTLHTWQGALAVLVYAPLLAWGPLLGGLAVSYHRRRSVRA